MSNLNVLYCTTPVYKWEIKNYRLEIAISNSSIKFWYTFLCNFVTMTITITTITITIAMRVRVTIITTIKQQQQVQLQFGYIICHCMVVFVFFEECNFTNLNRLLYFKSFLLSIYLQILALWVSQILVLPALIWPFLRPQLMFFSVWYQ